MCSILNGIALHGGFIPYGSSFLCFTDYARPSIRLAALMEIQVVFVFTHDSIGLGEDGPTHQPIEHLSSLRAIPHLTVIRPGDANEGQSRRGDHMTHTQGPVLLALVAAKSADARDRTSSRPPVAQDAGSCYVNCRDCGKACGHYFDRLWI